MRALMGALPQAPALAAAALAPPHQEARLGRVSV